MRRACRKDPCFLIAAHRLIMQTAKGAIFVAIQISQSTDRQLSSAYATITTNFILMFVYKKALSSRELQISKA